MTFVTKIELQSGNRPALEQITDSVQSLAERKGAELKGPHSDPPEQIRVPQYKDTTGASGQRFGDWGYTVYSRKFEIVGHNGLARKIAGMSFPDGVHVEAEVEQIQSLGN